LAKSYGAIVTGVCSTANIDLVKSIGADKVIDYTKEDFTQNGEIYDLILDSVNTISVSHSLNSLTKNGIMILSAAGMPEMFQGMWISATSNRKVLSGMISHNAEDILYLKGLVEAQKFKAVIDRTYPLSQVAEAHTYVEKGHKKGNVVIEV
jgi:NADPH:quinone reductase-like Zn-dependent oxidoreductase